MPKIRRCSSNPVSMQMQTLDQRQPQVKSGSPTLPNSIPAGNVYCSRAWYVCGQVRSKSRAAPLPGAISLRNELCERGARESFSGRLFHYG